MNTITLINSIDNTSVISGKFIFDTNCNLYIEVNEKIFQINVDKNNEPYGECGDYSIDLSLDDPINFGELKIIDPASICGKTLKKAYDEYDSNDSDNDESLRMCHDRLKYFPEDMFCTEIFPKNDDISQDENSEDDSDDHTEKIFLFPSSEYTEIPKPRKHGDFIPLYETLIFGDDKKNIIVKTKITGINPLYRLVININGTITFRPTGCKETNYILGFDGEKIIFIK